LLNFCGWHTLYMENNINPVVRFLCIFSGSYIITHKICYFLISHEVNMNLCNASATVNGIHRPVLEFIIRC
jgi:hypothetical protein